MEIERQILDKDGSARDINIDNIDIPKACGIVELLSESYSILSAFTGEGQDISSQITNQDLRIEIFEKENGYVDLSWQCPENLIRNLQVFFSWDVRGEISVELTFFPEDIEVERFNLDRFMDFLKPIIKVSGTQHFYVRYENVSWEYGDVSRYSSVIFYNLDAQKILEK